MSWPIETEGSGATREQRSSGPEGGANSRAAVLMLVTRLNIGGPARLVLDLAKQLGPELGVAVAAGRPPEEEGELSDPAVAVTRLPLVRPVRPRYDVAAFTATRSLLVRTAPAVVHTHMAKAGAIGRLAALSLARGRRPRLVHTFHGHVLQGYFASAEQRAFLALERRLARASDALVAVSPEVRDELVDLGVGRPGQYRVIPVGLNLDQYFRVAQRAGQVGALRRSLGLPGSTFVAGVVGRLVPIKDHATLLRALVDAPDVHLAVLGDGELRSSLHRLAADLGVADRAHFTGWWADMPAALEDLDLVVLPSRNEGTPLALVEASAAGRPVLATDVGGVRHVVEAGVTGWLCRAGDSTGLAGRMQSLAKAPELGHAAGREGRRLVAPRFGMERTVVLHRELYREMLGQRPPGHAGDATAPDRRGGRSH